MRHGGNVWEGGKPERWLDFSANLRPEGPPEWVLECMRRALADVRYYPQRSMKAARNGLAEYLGVDPSQVLPTAGGAAAIDLALAQRGGKVYVQPPTFGEYAQRAWVHHRQTAVWQGGCAQGDTLVLCNPNNPTGTAMGRAEMRTVLQQVLKAGAELVVDEAFGDYCPENTMRHEVCTGLTVVGSLTKTLCIPGARLGYICADAAEVERLESQALPWALNTLAASVAAQLPAHREEMLRDTVLNVQRREAFAQQLGLLGAKVFPSQSNFLLVDFHRDMTRTAAWLKERGVLVRTCASFGLPSSHIRLAVKTGEENIRLIQMLKQAMEDGYAR